CALVLLPVLADVQPLHDAHVGVVDEPVAGRGGGADATAAAAAAAAGDDALALQVVDGDEAAEVADRRRLVPGQVVVDVERLPLHLEPAARDGFGHGDVGPRVRGSRGALRARVM